MARSLEPYFINTSNLNQKYQKRVPRILSVIPGDADGNGMIFAKKQVLSLENGGVINKTFYLISRTSLLSLIKEWKRFRKELKSFGPDLIHAHFGTMTAFFCMISTTLPLVITYRGSDLDFEAGISRLRSAAGQFLSQISALRASEIICVSNSLKERLWWRKKYAIVIPTGVDTKIFYPYSRDKARLELGWNNQEKIVLFNAGSNPVRKRLDLAQSAVDIARTICGEIRFEVLNGNVDQKKISAMMNGADCLVCTSDLEGSPNIVKESLACNLPVVSVDVGDVKERLKGVQSSKIVARDHKEIGRALAEVLTTGCRSNGYETIGELSWERIATRILGVYQKILKSIDNH